MAKRKYKPQPAPPVSGPLPIPVGTVAVQTVPWIGYFQKITPFWQVRDYAWHDKTGFHGRAPHSLLWGDQVVPEPKWELKIYATAVPYTAFPGEVQWFTPDYLLPLSVTARVPDFNEIDHWYTKRNDKKRPNEFLAGLNREENSWPPFGPDIELFAQPLQRAGFEWEGWTRGNFYERLAALLKRHNLSLEGKMVWSGYIPPGLRLPGLGETALRQTPARFDGVLRLWH